MKIPFTKFHLNFFVVDNSPKMRLRRRIFAVCVFALLATITFAFGATETAIITSAIASLLQSGEVNVIIVLLVAYNIYRIEKLSQCVMSIKTSIATIKGKMEK